MKLTPTLTLFASLLALAGCMTSPPRPPQPVSINCKIPVITTLPETKEAQEKGGLEISIVPTIYKGVKKERYTTRQVQPPTLILFTPTEADKQKVWTEQTVVPYLEPTPGRIQFSVRVNNKLARVFRGQGAVVQFNVAGKMIPFNKIDYKDFVEGIVPPRNEATFTILGPSFDLIPEKGTIGIDFYDVVTATDAAGNITEKQNYEWFFNYEMKTAEENAYVTVTRGTMDIPSFQEQLARERQTQMTPATP